MRSRLKLKHLGLAIALATMMFGAAGKAEAGLVTYFFDESGGSSTIGAAITFNTSLPITSPSQVVSFLILDSKVGPLGDYTLAPVVAPINSTTPGQLTSGGYVAFNSHFNPAATVISSTPGLSVLVGANGSAQGTWVTTLSAVPEPSSLALGFVGAFGSLGFAVRRWRKSGQLFS
jgi:hypothetical protein